MLSTTTSWRLYGDEQRHLEPLPVAIDVGEPDFPEIAQLGCDVQQTVRGILVL
jgi:hypothetical protein